MNDRAPDRVPTHWPHRALSRSIDLGNLSWHVQVGGSGPVIVLLHGTGASAHSWAHVMTPLLAHATVVVPDLPGHGYTTGASLASLTLPKVAAALDDLMSALDLGAPALVVGHSAGAALALRWAIDSARKPGAIVGFAPSLVAAPAAYTTFLAPLLVPLATSSPMTALLAAVARRTGLIDRLLASTGSTLTAVQRERYAELFQRASHVRGAMGLMAAADLPAIEREALSLTMPMAFVLGQDDAWIPDRLLMPVLSRALPTAAIQRWPGGHLVHEETPQRAADFLLQRLPQKP